MRYFFLFVFLFLNHDALCAHQKSVLPYQFSASLVHKGNQQARLLGLPTANIYPRNIDLASGTYAGFVLLKGEKKYRKALYYVPSQAEIDRSADRKNLLEVHVIGLDFKTDLYDQKISGKVLVHISDPVPWTTFDAMKEKFQRDKACCLEVLENLEK